MNIDEKFRLSIDLVKTYMQSEKAKLPFNSKQWDDLIKDAYLAVLKASSEGLKYKS